MNTRLPGPWNIPPAMRSTGRISPAAKAGILRGSGLSFPGIPATTPIVPIRVALHRHRRGRLDPKPFRNGPATRSLLRHVLQPHDAHEDKRDKKELPAVIRHLEKKDLYQLDADQRRTHPDRQGRRRRDRFHGYRDTIDVSQPKDHIPQEWPDDQPVSRNIKKTPPVQGF